MHSSCLFQSQRTNYFNPCSSHVLLFSDGHQDVKKLSSHRQWNGCWHQQTVWQDGELSYNRNINPIIFVSYTNGQDVEEGEAVNKDLCFCLCGCLYLMMQHVGHRRITARFTWSRESASCWNYWWLELFAARLADGCVRLTKQPQQPVARKDFVCSQRHVTDEGDTQDGLLTVFLGSVVAITKINKQTGCQHSSRHKESMFNSVKFREHFCIWTMKVLETC